MYLIEICFHAHETLAAACACDSLALSFAGGLLCINLYSYIHVGNQCGVNRWLSLVLTCVDGN